MMKRMACSQSTLLLTNQLGLVCVRYEILLGQTEALSHSINHLWMWQTARKGAKLSRTTLGKIMTVQRWNISCVNLFWVSLIFFLFYVAKFYWKKWHWTKHKSNWQNYNQMPCLEGLWILILGLLLSHENKDVIQHKQI